MLEVIDLKEDDLMRGRYDAILCCSGYEQRARFLPKKMVKANALNDVEKWVIRLSNFEDHPQREKNDKFFRNFGFEVFCDDWDQYGRVSARILSQCQRKPQPFRLLVDYSAMIRTIYSEIIFLLHRLAHVVDLEVTFSYSVGIPIEDRPPKIISDYILLPGFEGNTDSQREKFAIYCLGFEPVILHSIHEWIEPSSSVAFFAEPGMGKRSGSKCLKLNRRFLEENDCKAYPASLYSVRNFVRAFTEVVKYASVKRDVMVFSCGPKPFVLASLLASTADISPAHVYARGIEAQAVDNQAIGKLIATKIKKAKIASTGEKLSRNGLL